MFRERDAGWNAGIARRIATTRPLNRGFPTGGGVSPLLLPENHPPSAPAQPPDRLSHSRRAAPGVFAGNPGDGRTADSPEPDTLLCDNAHYPTLSAVLRGIYTDYQTQDVCVERQRVTFPGVREPELQIRGFPGFYRSGSVEGSISDGSIPC